MNKAERIALCELRAADVVIRQAEKGSCIVVEEWEILLYGTPALCACSFCTSCLPACKLMLACTSISIIAIIEHIL